MEKENELKIVADVPEKGVTVLKLGDSFLRLKIGEREKEYDVDRIVKIDIVNLIADFITTPVLISRWGVILADAKSEFQKKKLDFEIFCSQKKEEIRKEFIETKNKFTIAEVEDALILDSLYRKYRNDLISYEKTLDIINNIFWCLKDKSNKLDKLSLTISKDDLDNLNNIVLNGVQILVKQAKIK